MRSLDQMLRIFTTKTEMLRILTEAEHGVRVVYRNKNEKSNAIAFNDGCLCTV